MNGERKTWALVCALLGALLLGVDGRWSLEASGERLFVGSWYGVQVFAASAVDAVAWAESFAPGVGGFSLGDPVAWGGLIWMLGALGIGWRFGRWAGALAALFAVSPWMPWFVMGRGALSSEAYLGVRDLAFGAGAGLLVIGAAGLWGRGAGGSSSLNGARSLLGAVVFSVLAPLLISEAALDGEPLTNDGVAYRFQAELFSEGEVVRDVGFLGDFFPARQILPGQLATSKYPPGHSAVLAVGEVLGTPRLVVLLLAGLGTLLTFHLARRLGSSAPGAAAWIFSLSPMVVGVNSLWLSHGTSLPMGLVFLVCWLGAWDEDRPVAPVLALLAGFGLSMVFAARPLTAVALAVPVVVAGLGSLNRRRLILVGLGLLGFIPGLMLFLSVNDLVTGSPWRAVYDLYAEQVSPNDKWGLVNLATALPYTAYNLARLSVWLLGGGAALGLLLYAWRDARLGRHGHLTWSLGLSLLGFYALHRFQGGPWVGPVYLVEAVPAMAVLGGLGLVALGQRLRVPAAWLLVAVGASGLGLLSAHMQVARGEADLRRGPRVAAEEAREELGRDVLVFVAHRNGAEQKRWGLAAPKLVADPQSGLLRAVDGVILALDLGARRNGEMRALFGDVEVRYWDAGLGRLVVRTGE